MFRLPIFVIVDGGLGNQLFQAAHGLSLARRFGRSVIFISLCRAHRAVRQCELRYFGLSVVDFGRLAARCFLIGVGILRRLRVDALFSCILIDRGQDSEGVRSCPLLVVGYWQRFNCYMDSVDLLRERFSGLRAVACDMYDDRIFFDTNCLAVHVRRGDYVEDSKAAVKHNVCTLAYFRRAVDVVLSSDRSIKSVVVFSDDPNWVRENLSFSTDTVYVESIGVHAWIDMLRMASCGHFVISNSTYSLWAALLSVSAGSRVSPNYWFANVKTSDLDLLGAEWREVDAF